MDLGQGLLTCMDWAIVNLGGPCGTGKVTERAERLCGSDCITSYEVPMIIVLVDDISFM
jgi:hypothetical protein